jgi:hypothetical protein
MTSIAKLFTRLHSAHYRDVTVAFRTDTNSHAKTPWAQAHHHTLPTPLCPRTALQSMYGQLRRLVEVVGFGGGGVEDRVYTEHFVGTNVTPLRSAVLGAVHNVGLRCAHVGKFAGVAHASCMPDEHA